jgi:glycosyltransferase involved in cell wall biosynthesis
LIVFAVPDFDPIVGGTTRQTRVQAEALARRGHHVCVLTRRLAATLAPHELVDGLDVIRVGPPGRGPVAEKRALSSVSRWLHAHRREIDVVQVVMWPDAAIAATLAGLGECTALLWAIRGEVTHTLDTDRSPWRRPLSALRRSALARVEHVVLTQAMAEEFEELGLNVRPTVIPVPVDRAHFRPPTRAERETARAAFGVSGGTFVVVFVGHLQERKAVDRLVDAVADLRAGGFDIALLVVGGGRGAPDDTDAALRRQVHEADLEAAVTFTGVAPDPRPSLWAADALALPSQREGMPNSLLEALACGLPCVAPPSAGGADVLTDAVGIVPESNDPHALARALETLIRGPERRAAMSAAAPAYAERFDPERVADAYERLYDTISERKHG